MNDLRRLLESDNSEVRDLLAAGLHDSPRSSALARTAAALGVAVPTVALAATPAAKAAALAGQAFARSTEATATAGLGAGAAQAASHTVAGMAVKWILIGALGGSLSAGGWASLRTVRPAEAPALAHAQTHRSKDEFPPRGLPATAPAQPTTSDTTAEPALGPVLGRPLLEPSLVASMVASPTASGSTGMPRASRPPAPVSLLTALEVEDEPSRADEALSAERAVERPESFGALARETSLIDAARRAVARRDWTQAEALLETYDATRRLGVLDREALLVRIEIHAHRGERESAERMARAFVAQYPDDAHVRRLRTFLNESLR